MAAPSLRPSLSLVVTLLAVPALAQQTVRVSVSSTGMQVQLGSSSWPTISPDARFIVFESDSSELAPGDLNPFADIYLHDRRAHTTEMVSLRHNGLASTSGGSTRASMSDDARYVAFMSRAPDLVPGDFNGQRDVFVRDRVAGTTEILSRSTLGVAGNAWSGYPSISADGRYVAFDSWADTLVPGDANGKRDVFVRDRVLGTTELVSVDGLGTQGPGDSSEAAISADGRYVAFSSVDLFHLGFGLDVYVRDRLAGTTRLVSVALNPPLSASGLTPSISADGRWIAFYSGASNLVSGDVNQQVDVFVRDMQLSVTELVSVGPLGLGDGYSQEPSISADGRFVAFQSFATNLLGTGGDTNGAVDVFVHDRLRATTERVSVGSSGAQASSGSQYPSISGDGRSIAFVTIARLVSADTNSTMDAYVNDSGRRYPTFCFGDGLDLSHVAPCPCGNVGAPGNGCANSVQPAGASLSTSGIAPTDDVALHAVGMPTTQTSIFLQGDALDDAVFGDGVRCTGGALVRLAARMNAAGASSFPDATDTLTLSARGGVSPFAGVRRYYQTYYRNVTAAFCPPATFNVTNGVIVDW